MGWVFNATTRPFYPRERAGIHCIGVRLSTRASLDGCGESHPRLESIPGPSSQKRVDIPTELGSTPKILHGV